LFDRLDGAPGSAVIWITGPPECGKTALAASYLEQRTRCRPSDARHAHRRREEAPPRNNARALLHGFIRSLC